MQRGDKHTPEFMVLKRPSKVLPYTVSSTIAPATMYEMYVTLRLNTKLYTTLDALLEAARLPLTGATAGATRAAEAATRDDVNSARCIFAERSDGQRARSVERKNSGN
jgi:hypothetical protein